MSEFQDVALRPLVVPFRLADDILRGRRWTAIESDEVLRVGLLRVAFVLVLFGTAYGAVMGSFSGFRNDRWLQVLFSASKVPLLLAATTALSLPSFFVLHTLLGLRDDFGRAFRALLSAQAGLTVALLSLAPLTALWYVSTTDYQSAILFNGLMFGISSLSAQVVLRRLYRPLIAKSPKHRVLLRAWLGVYAFVGIQMGWILRPFIGAPNRPVQFFRPDSWGNAYEQVLRILLDTIGILK